MFVNRVMNHVIIVNYLQSENNNKLTQFTNYNEFFLCFFC